MYSEICLVDDSQLANLQHEVLLRTLKRGKKVTSFTDSRKALDHLSSDLYPGGRILVLLDINMPLVSGFAFLELMELQKMQTRIDVVIVTSSEQAVHRMLAEQFPQYLRGYMNKPLNLEEVKSFMTITDVA